MAVDRYIAKASLTTGNAQAYRCRDNIQVMPDLMVEVHEKEDGRVLAYAIPPPTRHEDDIGIVDMDFPTSLQQAGNDVLSKRMMEMQVENDALRAYNTKLEEQNTQLLDRLMHYADRALEVLHGEDTAPSSGGSPAKKKQGASTSAGNGQGTEEQS